jgi:ferritin-like metal-binding protein YciE
MAIQSMQDLMLEELRELYSAERLALRSYPRLRKSLQTQSLREAVEQHTEQTKGQVERLERVFELLEQRPRAKTCHAMQGLLEEAQEHAKSDLPAELLEVQLIADLQKVEHFEIAAYGSAVAHARALGMDEAAEQLEATLGEERETDLLLNRIALDEVNPQAVAEPEEEEEAEEEAAPPPPRKASSRSRSGSKSRAAAR